MCLILRVKSSKVCSRKYSLVGIIMSKYIANTASVATMLSRKIFGVTVIILDG